MANQHSFYVPIILLYRNDHVVIVMRKDTHETTVGKDNLGLWILLQVCIRTRFFNTYKSSYDDVEDGIRALFRHPSVEADGSGW